jgi:hypothetical protein
MSWQDGVAIAVALYLLLSRGGRESVTAMLALPPENGVPGQWIVLDDGSKVWYPDESTQRVPADPGMSDWPPQ